MKNNKKVLFALSIIIFCCLFFLPNKSFAFTRIIDILFNNEPVNPDELESVIETAKTNKLKNKKNGSKKPDKLIPVIAKFSNAENIQLEVDTSGVLVKGEDDIQAAISNQGFLDAITEAINLWDDVTEAKITFAPLKFASGQANPEDGKNLITFRAIEDVDGVADGTPAVSIVTFAKTDTVNFMNKLIMVKPGTILDADIIFDPTNDPCLALFTTVGSFKIGGNNLPISEGGVDSTADPSLCNAISTGDITDLAVRAIGNVLGLESSAIASSANSPVALIMTKYSLTSDDKIGLANIYPEKNNLTNTGTVTGKVLLNKSPVRGAHVVLVNSETGEPTASTITDLSGKFIMKYIPAGIYTVYAEPLDGPVRKNALTRNFYGLTAQTNFTTGIFPDEILISNNKKTNLTINVKELSASAFNINYLTAALTEDDVNKSGGGFFVPIRIMPGETLTDVQFWGSNISPDFGTLSISGTGISVSNLREDTNISISTFMGDPLPQVLPGIVVDITCSASANPGPRNIIFTGDSSDPEAPSFGLIDQITGGIIITE